MKGVFILSLFTSLFPVLILGDNVEIAREYSEAGRIKEAYKLMANSILEAESPEIQFHTVNSMIELTKNSQNQEERSRTFILNALEVQSSINEPYIREYLLFHIGKQYTALGEYEKSVNYLNSVIDKSPKSEWLWSMKYQVALNYYLQNKYDQAIEKFELLEAEGVPYESKKLTLGYQMISCYCQVKDWKNVIERANQLFPDCQEDFKKLALLSQCAFAYGEVGDILSSLSLYEEYLDLHRKLIPEPNDAQKRKRRVITELCDRLNKKQKKIYSVISQNGGSNLVNGISTDQMDSPGLNADILGDSVSSAPESSDVILSNDSLAFTGSLAKKKDGIHKYMLIMIFIVVFVALFYLRYFRHFFHMHFGQQNQKAGSVQQDKVNEKAE